MPDIRGDLPETLDGLTIRKATAADVYDLVAMMIDDDLGKQREVLSDPLPEGYLRAFAAIDSDPRHELIVVEREGAVVATAHITYLPGLSYQGAWRALIESVRVTAALRSHGIGAAMMHWAIARSRAKGCHVLQLTTHKSRLNAHRFYARLGFVASHEGMKLTL